MFIFILQSSRCRRILIDMMPGQHAADLIPEGPPCSFSSFSLSSSELCPGITWSECSASFSCRNNLQNAVNPICSFYQTNSATILHEDDFTQRSARSFFCPFCFLIDSDSRSCFPVWSFFCTGLNPDYVCVPVSTVQALKHWIHLLVFCSIYIFSDVFEMFVFESWDLLYELRLCQKDHPV